MSAAENKDKRIGNGASTSDATIAAAESENDDEIGIVSPFKKRKLPDDSDISNAAAEARNHKQLQVIDDEDDLVLLEGNVDGFKKRRL